MWRELNSWCDGSGVGAAEEKGPPPPTPFRWYEEPAETKCIEYFFFVNKNMFSRFRRLFDLSPIAICPRPTVLYIYKRKIGTYSTVQCTCTVQYTYVLELNMRLTML